MIVSDDGVRRRRKGYLDRRAAPAECEAHLAIGDRIGLVPPSVGYATVDVDTGTPEDRAALEAEAPPALKLPSGRPGREHWYYHNQDPSGLGNFAWQWRSCAGELRVTRRGYVILHGDAAASLAAALANPGPRRYFPRRFFEAAAGEAAELRARTPATSTDAGVLDSRLEQWLFDATRDDVYPLRRQFTDRGKFNAEVLAVAAAHNLRAAKPLPYSRVRKTARSIAEFCWPRTFGLPRSTEWQRHAAHCRAMWVRWKNKPRDERMAAMRSQGRSWREVGASEAVAGSTAMRAIQSPSRRPAAAWPWTSPLPASVRRRAHRSGVLRLPVPSGGGRRGEERGKETKTVKVAAVIETGQLGLPDMPRLGRWH